VRGNLFSFRGLAVLALCGLCLVGCALLAWWQWNRFESASGTLQNLAYVLQWPLFGLFPFFMVWRMRRLAAQRVAREGRSDEAGDAGSGATGSTGEETGADASVATRSHASAPRRERSGPPPWRAPRPRAPLPDDGTDEELAAYNRYLAQLNAKDRDGGS
jgi:hypothetical protein